MSKTTNSSPRPYYYYLEDTIPSLLFGPAKDSASEGPADEEKQEDDDGANKKIISTSIICYFLHGQK